MNSIMARIAVRCRTVETCCCVKWLIFLYFNGFEALKRASERACVLIIVREASFSVEYPALLVPCDHMRNVLPFLPFKNYPCC